MRAVLHDPVEHPPACFWPPRRPAHTNKLIQRRTAPARCSLVYGELPAQCQVLEGELAAAADEEGEEPEHVEEEADRKPGLCAAGTDRSTTCPAGRRAGG